MADDIKAHEKTAATHAVAATQHAQAAVAHTKAAVAETQARGPTPAAHAHTTAAAQHAALSTQHANVAAAHANTHETKATHFDAPAKTQHQAAAAVLNARSAARHANLAVQHAALAQRVQGPTQYVRPIAVARPGVVRPGLVQRPFAARPGAPAWGTRPAAPGWGRPAAPAFGQPSWLNRAPWAGPAWGGGYGYGEAPPSYDEGYADMDGGDGQAPLPPHRRHGGKQEKIRAWAQRIIQEINGQDPVGMENLTTVQAAVQTGNPAALFIYKLVMADPGVQQIVAALAPSDGASASTPAPPDPSTMADASGF